jgi:hypothetical protein
VLVCISPKICFLILFAVLDLAHFMRQQIVFWKDIKMSFKVTVVGAGIHGLSIAKELVDKKRVRKQDLTLIDATGKPLGMWQKMHQNQGLSYYGNPLLRAMNAVQSNQRRVSEFPVTTSDLFPYIRGLMRFYSDFETSCSQQGARSAIQQGVVASVTQHAVTLASGRRIPHDMVILSTGLHPAGLRLPEWFTALKQQAEEAGVPVFHSLEGTVDADVLKQKQYKHFFVLGAGAGAVNMAAGLIENHGKTVTLVVRKPLTDSLLAEQTGFVNPYYTPECHQGICKLPEFLDEKTSEEERSQLIRSLLPRGMNKRYAEQCQKWVKTGKLRVVIDPNYLFEVDAKTKRVVLHTKTPMAPVGQSRDGAPALGGTIKTQEAHGLILSTGFALDVKKDELYQQVLTENQLAVHSDGLAHVDKHLTWLRRDGQPTNIKVSGYVASHQLGPNGMNAAGAKMAALAIASDPIWDQFKQPKTLNVVA